MEVCAPWGGAPVGWGGSKAKHMGGGSVSEQALPGGDKSKKQLGWGRKQRGGGLGSGAVCGRWAASQFSFGGPQCEQAGVWAPRRLRQRATWRGGAGGPSGAGGKKKAPASRERGAERLVGWGSKKHTCGGSKSKLKQAVASGGLGRGGAGGKKGVWGGGGAGAGQQK
ncbi:hypothetical protein Zmor_027701 [Zophobas morio]|uniref:Uncharacterized protein n=1 Tax=Zophobas morio TaxID=2755281 RepID=A0AA38HQ89_9CUCU|nr:hypothetical protein Zmor_027701 [Zophobas morio]